MADLATSLNPDVIKRIKPKYSTTVTVFENRSEQRFANDHVGEREFEIKWVLVPDSTRTLIEDFFDDQLGQWGEWTINDSRIGAGDILVRFTVDELDITPVKFTAFNVSAKIKTL